jgi:hypothetical protein
VLERHGAPFYSPSTETNCWGVRNSDMSGSGPDMSGQPLWNPAWGPNMSGLGLSR